MRDAAWNSGGRAGCGKDKVTRLRQIDGRETTGMTCTAKKKSKCKKKKEKKGDE